MFSVAEQEELVNSSPGGSGGSFVEEEEYSVDSDDTSGSEEFSRFVYFFTDPILLVLCWCGSSHLQLNIAKSLLLGGRPLIIRIAKFLRECTSGKLVVHSGHPVDL